MRVLFGVVVIGSDEPADAAKPVSHPCTLDLAVFLLQKSFTPITALSQTRVRGRGVSPAFKNVGPDFMQFSLVRYCAHSHVFNAAVSVRPCGVAHVWLSLGAEAAGVEHAAARLVGEVARATLPLYTAGEVSARDSLAQRFVDAKDVWQARWLIVSINSGLLS